MNTQLEITDATLRKKEENLIREMEGLSAGVQSLQERFKQICDKHPELEEIGRKMQNIKAEMQRLEKERSDLIDSAIRMRAVLVTEKPEPIVLDAQGNKARVN
jgi:predicted nuclease with TOPRIM domain